MNRGFLLRHGGGVTDSDLTLHQAAESLGVHYMTAYRYVRLGLLNANKVGGVWRVDVHDLEGFRASSPATQPSANNHVRGGRRRAPWSDRFEARLLAGDSRGAWGVIEGALTAGAGMDEVYLDVIAPALVSIGDRWASGHLCVSIEHRASGIVGRIVGRLGPRFARRGRTRGLVVLGAVEGERHSLPVAMLADLLRHRGWEVSDLGADVPTNSFGQFVALAADELVAVGLSASTDQSMAALQATVGAVREASPDTPIIVGGAAIKGVEHARAIGADSFADDGRELGALLDGLRPTG